jgi:hypothetical protein
MELSMIQTNLISLVGTLVTLAFAFGVLDETTEQIVVSAAGTIISLAFSVFAELRQRSKIKAASAAQDLSTLRKLASR